MRLRGAGVTCGDCGQGPFQSPHALKTHQAQWCKECSDDATGQDAAEQQDTSPSHARPPRLSSSEANTALTLDAQGIMMDTFTKLRTYHSATDGAIAEVSCHISLPPYIMHLHPLLCPTLTDQDNVGRAA